jgi:IS605 OrfB family transposase
MKLTVKVRLMPDAEQAGSLKAMTERFNAAADWIAGELFARKLTNKITAQGILYREIRARFGLSAQTAILALHRACEAYKRDQSIRPRFRKDAAITYDVRTMSFKGIDKVSLLTLAGRIVVPMIVTGYQAERVGYHKGQCDLARIDGKWYLFVTVEMPDGSPIEPTDFIGVDLGIANIATDSDGGQHSGKDVERVRRKHNLQRKRLQRRNTKGSKKKIRRMRDKEGRFRRHENHCISKRIVESARRTGRGIALEDLQGIRERVTARGGDARNRLSGWSFAQLGAFIGYKAKLAGVPVVFVDPAYTSRTCSECGHCERSNRKSQGEFSCKACGHEGHADANAARNIRARAVSKPAPGLGTRPIRRAV